MVELNNANVWFEAAKLTIFETKCKWCLQEAFFNVHWNILKPFLGPEVELF